MVDFAPMGEANYNYYLKHVLLLPLNAVQVEMLGRAELARYRALEALLPDPSMADPNPERAKSVPPDQEAFLKAYESREAEMIDFLKSHQLITLPDYLGKFEIRQLPEAFKQTSPRSFMNQEHTSELQSPYDLVCRLLLEKKKGHKRPSH